MSENIAIKVEHVSKNFVLPHEKVSSIKSIFTGIAGKHNKSKETQHALKDINFEVEKGEFFGIVGRNGSGKSTILKILAGIYQPSTGKVTTSGKLVPFIELGVGFNPELTGRENVYLNGAMLGFAHKEINEMYDSIVAFAELGRFMDQKLKNYSSGMQVRLAFSLAIRAQAEILLVDEVLAVGDADFQRKCFGYFKELKAKKKTVIFVTHDMNAVREYCDRAMLIDNSVRKMIGSPQDVAVEYAQLFINQDKVERNDSGNARRWGDKSVEIINVAATIVEENIEVVVEAYANQDTSKVIYGMHIIAQDGVEITAMNNRMIHLPDISDLAQGSTVKFRWKMLNIFNDGVYSITLTLVDDVGNTLDWFIGAADFKVMRKERSTTSVLPPVIVSHTINS